MMTPCSSRSEDAAAGSGASGTDGIAIPEGAGAGAGASSDSDEAGSGAEAGSEDDDPGSNATFVAGVAACLPTSLASASAAFSEVGCMRVPSSVGAASSPGTSSFLLRHPQ